VIKILLFGTIIPQMYIHFGIIVPVKFKDYFLVTFDYKVWV